ncbi:plasmid stabilization protein [Zunongwangia sp. F260]|uniref:Plasmid stabilization protein n=1 Tax=Autumnicola lenta TaxID=3075593 RepID=A0ABU3CPD0_9FLAO|nr:type II toxin-antitoxin system RelE/ParE family toxin [Zunongwangia sp. F260]MDT0648203.1 plasmid stabilization protein [Zunongwangia sp. F260]
MIITYHSNLKKDIRKINDSKIKKALLDKIQELKNCSNIKEVSGIKKLKGHSTAYRIRIGNYRLGFFVEGTETLRLQRFVKRNDIYKLFP